MTEISASFNGLDIRKNWKGKSDYLTTGSVVVKTDDSVCVYEQQIDINSHSPANEPHFQEILRCSKGIEIHPKKIKSKIIAELNHRPITF